MSPRELLETVWTLWLRERILHLPAIETWSSLPLSHWSDLSRSIGIPVVDRYCSLAIIYVMLKCQSVASKGVLLTLIRITTYVFQILHPNNLSLPGDRVRDNKGKSLLLRNVSLSNLCVSFQNIVSSPSYLDVWRSFIHRVIYWEEASLLLHFWNTLAELHCLVREVQKNTQQNLRWTAWNCFFARDINTLSSLGACLQVWCLCSDLRKQGNSCCQGFVLQ